MGGHNDASVAIGNGKPAAGGVPEPDRIAADIDGDEGGGSGSAQQFHTATAELRVGVLSNLNSPGRRRNDGEGAGRGAYKVANTDCSSVGHRYGVGDHYTGGAQDADYVRCCARRN